MEAQESGEMMEYVDEANFAMDGLRPGQPLRIRRASLVSLLSICGTMQRRRLLRTHGMVKPVLDAVLSVPTDDPPTALAAAALLYVMAGDGQDEDFFDSSDCIQFLMKLLGTCHPPLYEKKISSLGSKLLGLGSKLRTSKVERSCTGIDQGGAHVVDKVNYLLSSMKGLGDGNLKPDDQSACLPTDTLSSQWLALLTLEKACLSTVVLEDNAGSVRRVGGHFKERLRELGGLDALCELAASCFLNLREIVKMNWHTSIRLQKDDLSMEGSHGVGMLLRCLKVMENVTFLSENNQKHLLEMNVLRTRSDLPHTFVAIVVGTINTVSELILEKRSCRHRIDIEKQKIKPYEGVLSGRPQKTRISNTEAKESMGNIHTKRRSSRHEKATSVQKVTVGKSADPFDFHESDWSAEQDSLQMKSFKKQRMQDVLKEDLDSSSFEYNFSDEKVLGNGDDGDMHVTSKERMDNDAQEKVLLECLLSAVKVLMNLTNDNDLGCRQVAASGGLDAMASLITEHYPSFLSVSNRGVQRERFTEKGSNDQDLDLLVVILGVLVNLVEKDCRNRERLASLNVEGSYLTPDSRIELNNNGMIRLLCSIFLSKEGSGKAVESIGCKFTPEVDPESKLKQGLQEAEDMILEAYSALLLAFLSKESFTIRSAIAQHLPNGNLNTLVPVLERFLAFHLSLNMLSAETHAAVKDVIESCKIAL